MPDYYAIPTDIGEAKLANALALGVPLQITHLAVGDGAGAGAQGTPLPNPEQLALVSERRRAPINTLAPDPSNANVVIAEQIIPEDIGGWWIREMGLYDIDGALIAVCNTPPTYKPVLASGSGRTQVVRMQIIIADVAAVTLKIDPAVVLATRAYVDDKVSAEINKLDGKQSVRVATTAAIALNGLQTIDGVVLTAGDRVLVKDQAAAKDNGIYIVAAGAWTRAADADSSSDVTPGMSVAVEQGAANADNVWLLVTDGPIVLGTTALAFDTVGRRALAPIDSPAFTGNPTAPTRAPGDNSTKISTTAFVQAAIAALINSSPAALDTLNELAAALGNDANFAATITNALALKAPLASPAMTGNPTAPTPAQFDNDTSVATTEFVQRALGNYSGYVYAGAARSLLASDIGKVVFVDFTGNFTVPTPASLGVQLGSTVNLFSVVSNACSVVPGAGATINYGAGPVSNVVCKYGQSLTLVAVTAAVWQVINSTADLYRNPDFVASLTANGYQKLPSGLIVQWGTITASATPGAANAITFPIAFPTAARAILAIGAVASTTTTSAWYDSLFVTSVNLRCNAASAAVVWVAIGY